jgi:hypothetical protein
MLDANGSPISSSLARQMRAQIAMKFGDYLDDFWAEMHPSQIIEWENSGETVHKMGFSPTFEYQKMFLDFPLVSNVHLSPTVVLIRKNLEIVAEIGRLGMTNWNLEEVDA